MLSQILRRINKYEEYHGVMLSMFYINPLHYAALARENPALFKPGQTIGLGFRMAIVPACYLVQPVVAWHDAPRPPAKPGVDARNTSPGRVEA